MAEPESDENEKLSGLQQDVEATIAPLDGVADVELKKIDISFFDNETRKSTKLVDNDNEENKIKARSQWYEYDFKRILYIDNIVIFADGYDESDKIQLSVDPAFAGDKIRIEKSQIDGKFSYSVKSFCGGFGFKPPYKLLASPTIESIELVGAEPAAFERVIKLVSDVDASKAKIRKECQSYIVSAEDALQKEREAKSRITGLEKEISDLSDQEVNLNARKDELESDVEELSSLLVKSNQQNKELLDRKEAITSEINNNRAENTALQEILIEKRLELRGLEDDVYLFPSDIVGFVRESSQTARLYFWLSFIPMSVIAFIAFELYFNSQSFLLDFKKETYSDILAYLISRIPYMIVSVAILTVSFKLLEFLFSEIIEINRRKQDLHKISIIATDVSFAAQQGLELSKEEEYEWRTHVKMELLKEHLKQHVGKDFAYRKNRRLTNLFPSKISSLVSGSEETGGKGSEPEKSED